MFSTDETEENIRTVCNEKPQQSSVCSDTSIWRCIRALHTRSSHFIIHVISMIEVSSLDP